MERQSLRYQIIDECKCGYEELFVLLGLVDRESPDERARLAGCLEEMVKNELLVCEYRGKTKTDLRASELVAQIEERLVRDEDLVSYPECCEEYSFMSTNKALDKLSDEDKPEA